MWHGQTGTIRVRCSHGGYAACHKVCVSSSLFTLLFSLFLFSFSFTTAYFTRTKSNTSLRSLTNRHFPVIVLVIVLSNSSSKCWGYRFRVIPKLSQHLVAEAAIRHKSQLDGFHASARRWTPRQDAALISYVNDYCDKHGLDPLQMNPGEINPSSEDLLLHSSLEAAELQDMQVGK